MRVSATINYPAGHSYTFEYERYDELYCYSCGEKGCIWYETGAGDYYVGESYYCSVCAETFTIQEGGTIKKDSHHFAVIEAIRPTPEDTPISDIPASP